MGTRADLIEQVLRNNNGRMRTAEIHEAVMAAEGNRDVYFSAINTAVRLDNERRRRRGEAERFILSSSGRIDHGQIALDFNSPSVSTTTTTQPPGILDHWSEFDSNSSELIRLVNQQQRECLEQAISSMEWREFESNFMTTILESLGFDDISVTRPTRDGGIDGECTFRRGLVHSRAIVSAKHWKHRNVGPETIREIRGTTTVTADTGIVFTAARFTSEAIEAAQPANNFRTILLIDGEQIVRACFDNQIGVKHIKMDPMYRFVGFGRTESGN